MAHLRENAGPPWTRAATLRRSLLSALVVAGCGAPSPRAPNPRDTQPEPVPASLPFPSGVLGVYALTRDGAVDRQNPFFRSLGTTGTTCEHCHFAEDAFGVSADHLRRLFDESKGTHPVFHPHAANDPVAAAKLGDDATVEQRRAAYGLFVDRGLATVMIELRLPTDAAQPAELTLVGVDDPSLPDLGKVDVPGVGKVGDPAAYLKYTGGKLWVHRRPLPTANLAFVTATSWDGRTTPSPNPLLASVRGGLVKIARDTIAERESPPEGRYTPAEINDLAEKMTDLELVLFAAPTVDAKAGPLDAFGARGGPVKMARQPYFFGINDVLGDNPAEAPFSAVVFTLFDAWRTAPGDDRTAAREAVLRGQAVFNEKPLQIAGVGGLNDGIITLSDGVATQKALAPLTGTCGTCHDAPNVGNHSTRLPINIGVSDRAPIRLGREHVAGLPLFTLRNNATGEIVQTTDPGRAIRTGKWGHVGEFKGPILRGIAARPPYFHNGMARSLTEVVDFYDARFKAHLTDRERADLVAFLSVL
jgi:cytochrome c peroxidase